MKKVVVTFGLISSAIIVAFMFAITPFHKEFSSSVWIGYTTMVIALSMIFFGVKSYRDNHLQGAITFGTALKVGLLIAGVASLGYAIGWEFYFNLISPDFTEVYAETFIEKAKADGATAVELQKKMKEMEDFKEMYQNPLVRFGMTLIEIVPVGIVISLISAALLRKKNFMTSQPV